MCFLPLFLFHNFWITRERGLTAIVDGAVMKFIDKLFVF